MTSAITSSLGALGLGSGIDSAGLVRDLAEAARAPRARQQAIAEDRNRAQVGAIASTISALDTFAGALKSLFDGQGFYGSLASGDDRSLGVALTDGARPPAGTVTVIIDRLASAQVAHGPVQTPGSASAGGGLMLTGGDGRVHTITVAPGASLSAIATAIGSAGAGVTARVATDAAGERLILSGDTGAANGFTLGRAPDAGADLQALVDGMTVTQAAVDAEIRVDGAPMRYADNVVDGAVPGVRLTLRSATTTPVAIRNEPPEATIRQLMGEFVSAFNSLRRALGDATAAGAEGGPGGPLAGDAGVRDLMRALGRLPQAMLADADPQATLSTLGIRTTRDGTLSLDTARFDAAYAADPDMVRAWLDPDRGDGTPGIASALAGLRDRFTARDGPLTASRDRYAGDARRLATLRERIDDDNARYRRTLERSFTAMDVQLTRLRAVQGYVSQQIAMWTAQGSRS